MPNAEQQDRERPGEARVEPVLDRVHARQRRRVVAAQVRQDQRSAERKAVRGEGRDDVQRDDDGVGAHPVQDRARRPRRTPLTFLLEREAEFAALARRVGPGGCVLVRGPAGIGKSALLDEARDAPRARAARARERARALVRVRRRAAAVRARQGADSGAAAHAAAAFSVGGEPDHAVLHGLYWLTARPGPLAIVVDDAHWLDAPSLRWLAYMVNRVADLPLALILAARSDEPDELLSPDRPAPVDDRARRRSRSPPRPSRNSPARSAPRIHEATGGNPFYVHAMVASEDATPRPVVESIALRLEALPPNCLRWPARSRSPAAAGRSPPGSPGSTSATPSKPPRRWRRPTSCVGDGFAHPLVQQAVYASIPAAERAELHAQAAGLVDRGRADRRARHGRRPRRRRPGGPGAARGGRAPPGRAARPRPPRPTCAAPPRRSSRAPSWCRCCASWPAR